MTKQQVKSTPVIAVLNMKGGVGKTTVTAHVFRESYKLHFKSTLLIDLDPQFNLTQTVLEQSRYEDLRKANKTIAAVLEDQTPTSIYNICQVSTPAPSPSDLVTGLKHFKAQGNLYRFDLVPGDFRIFKFALANDDQVLAAARKRFLEFIDKCKETYGVVCIDCNPSSSFLTLCALKACTHLLIPVRPDRYSILGLQLLNDFIAHMPDLTKKPKQIILLNGTKSVASEIEKELRAHKEFGPLTLTNRLAFSKVLETKADSVGFATDRNAPNKVEIAARIRAVAAEIDARL